MPSLKDFIAAGGRPRVPSDFKTPLEPQAHFQEHQWILSGVAWDAGIRTLAGALPRHTRPERPRDWYSLLRGTHWPGDVPPGNGPFYLPEWAWDGAPPAERAEIEEALKGAGFRRVEAQVVRLPRRDYLVWALRWAGRNPWNVSPRLLRLYFYPSLRRLRKLPLREFTGGRAAR